MNITEILSEEESRCIIAFDLKKSPSFYYHNAVTVYLGRIAQSPLITVSSGRKNFCY